MDLRRTLLGCTLAVLLAACGSTVQRGTPGTAAVHESTMPMDSTFAAPSTVEAPGVGAGGTTGSGVAGPLASRPQPAPVTGGGVAPSRPGTGGDGAGGQSSGGVSAGPGGAGSPQGAPPAEGGGDAPGPAPAAPAQGGPRAPVAGTPGISDTDLLVGMVYTDQNLDEEVAAAGVEGVTFGDFRRIQQAVIDDVNARGGIAGRTVVPVWHNTNGAPDSATMQQGICATFTDDNEVFAALTPYLGEVLRECLANAGVAHLSSHGQSFVDRQRLAEYPHYVEINSLAIDLVPGILVPGLHEQGYFEGALVGLLHSDNPVGQRTVDDLLVPELARIGVTLAERVEIHEPQNTNEYGDTAAAIQAAVLRFRAAGVTHVMFQDPGSVTMLQLFSTAAEGQQYRPRYAVTGDTGMGAMVEAGVVVAEQARGALGVGWAPMIDVAAAEDPGEWPSRARCLELMAAKGMSAADRNGQSQYLLRCDLVWFLEAAVGAAPELSVEGLYAGIDSLGESFASSLVPATRYGPGRRFGVSQYRLVAYDEGCACMRYTSDARSLG